MNIPAQITQPRIEAEIERLGSVLEETTERLAVLSEDAAESDVTWKIAEAGAMLKSNQKSLDLRKADALLIHQESYHAYRISAAKRDAMQEKCRTLRSQIDALRTLAANVRGQT